VAFRQKIRKSADFVFSLPPLKPEENNKSNVHSDLFIGQSF